MKEIRKQLDGFLRFIQTAIIETNPGTNMETNPGTNMKTNVERNQETIRWIAQIYATNKGQAAPCSSWSDC